MKTTIHLDAVWHGDHLKIGIHRSEDTMWSYSDTSVSADMVRMRCREMAERLNRCNREGGRGCEAFKSIRSVGRLLSDELLPPEIKAYLATADAEYLMIKLDEHLVHIPWELLCTDEAFFCERFSMGRLVGTRQRIIRGNQRNPGENPPEMLIIANPNDDLDNADSEGEEIFRHMSQMRQGKPLVYPFLDTDITPGRIRLKLKDYDLVHFAGHAVYHPEAPEKSGWKLRNGLFTADDIRKMVGGALMPSLVFSNACQSARTEAWEWNEKTRKGAFGLTNAFLSAGVRHCLGTFWEISDASGHRFASEFYKSLLSGKPVGEAVRQARLSLIRQHADDTCWAAYVLYGDPRVRYLGQNSPTGDSEAKASAIRIPKARMRGKFRTWYERKFRGGQKWLTAFLTICVLLFGLILTDSHFTRKDMAAHAERKQEEMRFLIARAEEKFPGSPGIAKPEHQVSELLTMAITYDAVRSAYSRGSEAFVASAIENEIKKKLPHVRLVERKALNLILEELNLALSSLSENRIQPKLLNAKHILLIEIDRSLFQSFILMRLFDTETGTVIFSSVEKLESGRVASQNICENLLKVLLARGKHGMRETYGEDDF